MTTETQSAERSSDEGTIAGGGAIAGLAAIVSASCCILPVALVNLGASSALVANLSVLTPFRPWLIALTVILVGVGGAIVVRRGHRPTGPVTVLSGVAILLALAAIVVPVFERDILVWLN